MTRRMLCLALSLTACAGAVDPHRAATPDRKPVPDGPVIVGASDDRHDIPVTGDVAAVKDYAAANNAFGFELWQHTRTADNLAIAPASVSLALGMTWAGARGDTAAQMSKALRMHDVDAMTASMGQQLARWNDPAHRDDYELAVVDRLFGEQTARFEPDFLTLMKDRMGAPLEPVDFLGNWEGARARINGWVEDNTKDRIRDLLPPGSLDTDTRLVLTNAVYFKGDWLHAFEPNETHAADFFVGGKQKLSAKTMHQTAYVGYADLGDAQLVELPYRGEDLALDILLPRAKDGLDGIERKLDGAGFDAAVAKLKPQFVDLALPKFKLEMQGSLQLKPALQAMGIVDAFSGAADFTGISTAIKPFFIDDVYHKTFVALDEEGTEAAAATAVVMSTESAAMPPDGIDFTADHPFAFVLRDTHSGAVLFIGHVVDPR